MLITIKATITKSYERVDGEYLSQPYSYQEFIAMGPDDPNDPTRQGVMCFRVKGANLDRFISEGINRDKAIHTFHLLIDCKETTFRDSSVHPSNKMPVCVAWD